MSVEIDQARMADLLLFYADKSPAYVLRSDGIPVGVFGIYPRDGEHWGFVDIKGRLSSHESMVVLTHVRKHLKSLTHDVLAVCDEDKYPTAPKFLKALGMVQTDRVERGMKVWK